jgi:hypothetical protein
MQNEIRNRNHIEVDFYALFNFLFNITSMVRGVSADEIFVKKKKGSNLKSYLKDIL